MKTGLGELRSEMKTGFGEVRSEMKAGFDELSGRIDDTNARLDQANTKLDGISWFFTASEINVARLERRMVKLEDRVDEIDRSSQHRFQRNHPITRVGRFSNSR